MSLKSMLIQALGGGLLALSALTAQAAPLHHKAAAGAS